MQTGDRLQRLDVESHLPGPKEWILVHWQVLLVLLAKIQPPARPQTLRDRYPITPEGGAMHPKPPTAHDSDCHLNRCHRDYNLQQSAGPRRYVPRRIRMMSMKLDTSFCDPETYPTPEEIHSFTNQACYFVVENHL